jgi:photosystem II stability/assembly factor-like uncharacterized protein
MYKRRKKGFSKADKTFWLQEKFGGTYVHLTTKEEIYVVGWDGSLYLAKDDGTPLPGKNIHSSFLESKNGWIKTSDEPREYKFPNWCV